VKLVGDCTPGFAILQIFKNSWTTTIKNIKICHSIIGGGLLYNKNRMIKLTSH